MGLGLVDVVDKDDKFLKTIDRADAVNTDIMRVIGVFIVNDNDEILLQLRSTNSRRYPLYWDTSAGGHVDTGEDYDTAAKRELLEEIGIKTTLTFLGKHYIELDDGRSHFIAFYKGRYSGKMKTSPREVERVEFFSKAKIKKMITNGEKMHIECIFGLKKYFLIR